MTEESKTPEAKEEKKEEAKENQEGQITLFTPDTIRQNPQGALQKVLQYREGVIQAIGQAQQEMAKIEGMIQVLGSLIEAQNREKAKAEGLKVAK